MSTSAPATTRGSAVAVAVAECPAAAGPALGRRQVHAVAGSCFVAPFAALGLPPYLTRILPESGDAAVRRAGPPAAVGNKRFGPGAHVPTGTADAVTAALLVALRAMIRRSFHPRRSR
ncbi:hypothetical protein [Streptomyces sp. NPDC002994]|uniref:hypothetical protein n=1 Tax=Streptomyces sp. NPDC002994 TaxID=3154441 RepID=UPI0033B9A5F7